MNKNLSVRALTVGVAVLAAGGTLKAGEEERYRGVRELGPAGYWPADEGTGTVVHDRSGGGNPGVAHQVAWRDGLLDFTKDVYQWVQIPHRPEYTTPAFSLGGWVFSRRAHKSSRVLLIGQPFVPHPDGLRWIGWGNRQAEANGICLRFGAPENDAGRALVEIASGDVPDTLDRPTRGGSIAINEWQHLLYTYNEAGTGRLYVNGRLACSVEDVPAPDAKTPFAVGADMAQWKVWPPDARSLDGSVRDLILFDRALTPDEVERLCRLTRPDVAPPSSADTARTGDPEAIPRDRLVALVRDEALGEEQRAEAALALASIGPEARSAVPPLVAALEEILKTEGPRLPRIEDRLRNAILRALLDIDPSDPDARDLLGRAWAEPMLQSLDLTQPYLARVRTLADAGRPMDALEAFRRHMRSVPELPGHRYWGYACPEDVRKHLPLRPEYADAFLTKGNPFSDAPYRPEGCRPADYTPVDVRNGVTYLAVVERVSHEEAERHCRALGGPSDRPLPAEAKWSRIRIVRIDSAGNEDSRLLEGPWFVFDARDAKMDGWAVGVDGNGYIHVTGGQHNSPRRENYLPGSWERLGIADEDARPRIMYWVSTEPERIDSFSFAGQSGNPRCVPVGWMNYMNFARGPGGTLFLYGRDHIWTWGLYRYDADARRWTGLGGSPTAMLREAKTTASEWVRGLGETVPYYGPTPRPVLVAAWQPGAYNFCRSSWGVRFDPAGRMHVRMGIWGVGEDGDMTNGPVYAYSDDLGDTFHRADGTPLQLPLTVNPVPGHHADVDFHSTGRWLDLWISLLRDAGHSVP